MDIHFNGYKARYSFMNYHLQPITRSRKLRKVNIFINLDDLFHTLHRPLANAEFQVSGTNAHIELVSNVFNLLGHYRNWATKNGLQCNVYAIYSSATNSFKNSVYVPGYRKKFFDINHEMNGNFYFINSTLHDSYKVMHVIAKYIKHVHIIDSKYLEPSSVPFYIANEVSVADWNIMISRDTYDLQYCYQDKWTLISPKGDNSTSVNRENMWDYLNFKERVYKDPITLHYNHGLYLLAKAVVGDPYRNIPRLRKIGWKTLFKYLDKLELAKADENDNRIVQEHCFTELIRDTKLDPDVINRNLAALDVSIQQRNMLDIDKAIVTSQIMDLEDFANLQDMNRNVFHLYPINLGFLCNELIQNPFGV